MLKSYLKQYNVCDLKSTFLTILKSKDVLHFYEAMYFNSVLNVLKRAPTFFIFDPFER